MKQPLTFAPEPSILMDAGFMEFGYPKRESFFIAPVAGRGQAADTLLKASKPGFAGN